MFVILKKDYFGRKAGTTLDIEEPHLKSLLDRGVAEAVKADPYGPLLGKRPVARTSWLAASPWAWKATASPTTPTTTPPCKPGTC
jgi:hypothetical protein